MTSIRRYAWALGLVLVLGPSSRAGADPGAPPSCSLNGTTGLIEVRSATMQTPGVLALSLGGHYYESIDLSADLGGYEAGRYASVHLNASYGVTPWLEIGVDVPFRRVTWSGGAASAAVRSAVPTRRRRAVPASRRQCETADCCAARRRAVPTHASFRSMPSGSPTESPRRRAGPLSLV